MMKSSIPSSWGSTRELRLAGGGPWCSAWAWRAAASMGSGHRVGGLGDDVLDGLVRRLAHPLDEVGAQPTGPGRRKRRDDDVVDAEGVHRVHRRRVRVGV